MYAQGSQLRQQTKSTAASSTPAPPVLAPIAQQQAPVQVQQEPLVQRQPVRQQKETSAQANGYNSNSLPAKQLPAPQPPKIADLVKGKVHKYLTISFDEIFNYS